MEASLIFFKFKMMLVKKYIATNRFRLKELSKKPNEPWIEIQSVSGLEYNSESSSVEVKEGGVNDSVHVLPGLPRYSDLQLNGLVVASKSDFMQWIHDTLTSNYSKPIQPKNFVLELLDINDHTKPLFTWNFQGAYPVKRQFGTLGAEQSNVLTQSIWLRYSSFTPSF